MQYLLLDGAMTPDSSAKKIVFADNKVEWCAPLLGVKNLRMFSPFLIDLDRVFQIGGDLQKSLTYVVNACPMHLHASYFESHLSLEKMSDHLSKFICFHDQDMQTYGLRIADCRILSVLPQVLTMQQWTYLTSPIALWKIHTRKGELTPLPVKTAESTIEDEYAFTLNADQVDALVHASEADALLAHLGLDLNIVGNESHQYWVLSQTCLQTWEKSGSTNRGVLNSFAKRIFDSKGKALQEKPWQTFLAKATLNDFGG
jgi:Domain of unknown function (DUF4123)